MQVPARFDYEVADLGRGGHRLYWSGTAPRRRLLAGGHSLIPMMKLRLAFPEMLIDIHELDGETALHRGRRTGRSRSGALARHQDVLDSES